MSSDTSYPTIIEAKWETSTGGIYTVLRADFEDEKRKHIAVVNYDSSPTTVKEE